MLLLSSADFFSKSTFPRNYFSNTIRVANSLDPDQDRQKVGPDLGPNCLQRLSADYNRPLGREELKIIYSTTKETHQSLFGAIMEIRIKK